jgi:hypothetical protein
MSEPRIVSNPPSIMIQAPPELPPDLVRHELEGERTRDALHDTVSFVGEHAIGFVTSHSAELLAGVVFVPQVAAMVAAGIAGYEALHVLSSIFEALADAEKDGHRRGLLDAALGNPDQPLANTPETRAWRMGVAAVLGGYSQTEIARMETSFGGDRHRAHLFREAVESTRALRGTEAFEEARAIYQRIVRDFEDGRAAALGGWDRPGASEAFRAGREQMMRYLQANPREADALRQSYRAAHREGYLAAESGRIDEHRAALDAAYRAGIASYRREHPDSVSAQAERARVIGVPAWLLAEARTRV